VSAPDLSALVSARLCHDLISPMGAIGNGLELLQLSGNAGSEELALITDSLATALAKLRFYRIAFGPADSEARLTFEEAAQVTDAMFQGRFGVAWQADGNDMPRPLARLIYLAILCLEKSLPMGGTVRIDATQNGVSLAVDGRRTTPPPGLWALATDGAPVADLRPDGVQFALLRQALAATGHRLEASFTDSAAALRMTAPSPLPA
jgi:histidine phosphotransferase ChpT